MAWYAYCITEQIAFQENRARRPFLIEGLRGVGGAQVIGYPSGDFAIIVSEYVLKGQIAQKAVVEYARVVTECFRHGTVLPFRFGTVFDNEEAIRQAVRTNRKTFLQTVTHLRGKSEMHLKVMLRGPAFQSQIFNDATLPVGTGAEYLNKLHIVATRERERQTKARSVSLQVHKLFSPLDQEVTCKKVDSGFVLDIAHLIETKAVERYQNRLSSAVKQLKDCEVAISGPWPPYHFLPGKLRTVSSSN